MFVVVDVACAYTRYGLSSPNDTATQFNSERTRPCNIDTCLLVIDTVRLEFAQSQNNMHPN